MLFVAHRLPLLIGILLHMPHTNLGMGLGKKHEPDLYG